MFARRQLLGVFVTNQILYLRNTSLASLALSAMHSLHCCRLGDPCHHAHLPTIHIARHKPKELNTDAHDGPSSLRTVGYMYSAANEQIVFGFPANESPANFHL